MQRIKGKQVPILSVGKWNHRTNAYIERIANIYETKRGYQEIYAEYWEYEDSPVGKSELVKYKLAKHHSLNLKSLNSLNG